MRRFKNQRKISSRNIPELTRTAEFFPHYLIKQSRMFSCYLWQAPVSRDIHAEFWKQGDDGGRVNITTEGERVTYVSKR